MWIVGFVRRSLKGLGGLLNEFEEIGKEEKMMKTLLLCFGG